MTAKDRLFGLLVWKDLRKRCAKQMNIQRASQPEKIFGSNLIFHFDQPDIQGYFRVIENNIHSISSACKTKAYEEIAGMLGLEGICPKSELVSIPDYGVGLLQVPCEGICIMTKGQKTRIRMITPAFQKAMSDFNLLDVVCHEMDHSPNNYNVVIDAEENAVSVSAFDNNGIGTFSLRSDISFSTFLECSPFITESGTVNRPFVSFETVEALHKISLLRLYWHMKQYIGFIPTIFMYIRIIRLKAAIQKTSKIRSDFLRKEDQWDEKTIQEELDGPWGKTYLKGYIYDC